MKIKEEVRSLKSKETEGKTRTFWARKASRGGSTVQVNTQVSEKDKDKMSW